MSSILKRFFKYLFYVVAALAVLVAGLVAYLTWFQPPFYFPKPTGPYAVGVREYHWVDTTRKEIYSDDPAHPNRELMVKIWYPAAGQLPEKPTTPYAPLVVDWLSKNRTFFWLFSGLSRPTFTYAQFDPPFVTGLTHCPVILFSPGGGGISTSNTAQCEELASYGFVVAGVSHSYESWVVHFPDGRVITSVPDKWLPFKERRKRSDRDIEVRVADMRFVIDQLERLSSDTQAPLFQRFDTANVGAMGQSLGGATAIQLCRRDSRVKAGVDMDGSLLGVDATELMNKPLMFLLAQRNADTMEHTFTDIDKRQFDISLPEEEAMIKARYPLPSAYFKQITTADSYAFVVKGTGHSDFTDFAINKQGSPFRYLYPLLKNSGPVVLLGSINGFRATEIVNAYLVSFFNKYLKGQPSELLDGGERSKYPEVVTKQWEEKNIQRVAVKQ